MTDTALTTTTHWVVEVRDTEDGTRLIDYGIRERPAKIAAGNGLPLFRRDVTELPDGSLRVGVWEQVEP